MRKHGCVDGNQREIVDKLRDFGVSVWITSDLGNGGPDLVCGWKGHNTLLEVKNDKGKLTEEESDFHLMWKGTVYIVRSFEEALFYVTGIKKEA